ncbi:MAG: TIGR04222 domain-containing membrane protein [Pyrinomonadaceae bacterium]
MDILLDNPLATMYGPYFLIFYGFVIFFSTTILAIIKSRIDKTDNLSLPPIPAQIDPYEIAYLRGGTNEVVRSVVFSLMQKGFIELNTDGKTAEIKQTDNKTSQRGLSQIEQLALGWFYTPRSSTDVFKAGGLSQQLESYGQTYQSRLEQQQMLIDDETRSAFNPLKWTAYLVIPGLGAYKIFAAVAHGNFNIIFLIILIVVGLLVARAVSRLPRVTNLGKTYLERLQLAFENLKYEAQKPYIPAKEPQAVPQTTFAGVDPLLLSVGVFGSGILAGTIFDNYNQAFVRAQQQSAAGSCGSGCGSSCSSGDGGGSSCSSGSSCSGGSSCGGGCGGCGGGCS